jgi:hypothetical protein
MTNNPVRDVLQSIVFLTLLSVLSVTLLGTNMAFGQAGSKEAQKFQSEGEDAREDIQKASVQFDKTMSDYNAILNSEVDNPEKAFKSLSKDIDKSEKLWKTANKSFDSMQKAGNKLFSSWQKEVDTFTNEQMKQISMEQLEKGNAKYQQMVEQMSAAKEAYEPFISSLNEQALFMGRDLSTAAIEALQPLAEELNASAATLLASIDAVLNQEVEVADAEESAEPEEATDDTAADDTASDEAG